MKILSTSSSEKIPLPLSRPNVTPRLFSVFAVCFVLCLAWWLFSIRLLDHYLPSFIVSHT
jgi:hypothetical protein